MVEIQLLIMFYKSELKLKPDCIATKVLYDRNVKKLKEMKDA